MGGRPLGLALILALTVALAACGGDERAAGGAGAGPADFRTGSPGR